MPNKARLIVALALAITSWQAAAQATSVDDTFLPLVPQAPTSQLVGDMLYIDAQRALLIEQDKAARAGVSVSHTTNSPSASPSAESNAVVPPAAPSLRAIYGIGKVLHADLSINGQLVTFRNGRSAAVFGDAAGYRLTAIASPCVKLKAENGELAEVCDVRVHR